MSTPTSTPSSGSSVLFVCLGNICRSTMAEGAFRSLTAYDTPQQSPLISRIDSCGTGAYHAGDPPDSRTMSVLADHGITTYKHKARRVRVPEDFREFDYVLAMDLDNEIDLREMVRRAKKRGTFSDDEAEEAERKIWLYGEFGSKGLTAGKKGKRGGGDAEEREEVQDPYYGGREGFTTAWKQLDRFGKGLLAHIEAESKESKADGE